VSRTVSSSSSAPIAMPVASMGPSNITMTPPSVENPSMASSSASVSGRVVTRSRVALAPMATRSPVAVPSSATV
jgi:hypothetical protein